MFNPNKIIQRSPDFNSGGGRKEFDKVVCPNKEIQALWPSIDERIKREIKENSDSKTPFETRIRTILKEELGAELIKTNDQYRQFFKDALRYAINLDTDKMLNRIAGGRNKWGEARHAKGKIQPDLELLSQDIDE